MPEYSLVKTIFIAAAIIGILAAVVVTAVMLSGHEKCQSPPSGTMVSYDGVFQKADGTHLYIAETTEHIWIYEYFHEEPSSGSWEVYHKTSWYGGDDIAATAVGLGSETGHLYFEADDQSLVVSRKPATSIGDEYAETVYTADRVGGCW